VANPNQPEDSMSDKLHNSKRNLAKRLKIRFHGYNKKLEKVQRERGFKDQKDDTEWLDLQ
jgi:hypothetical protein